MSIPGKIKLIKLFEGHMFWYGIEELFLLCYQSQQYSSGCSNSLHY